MFRILKSKVILTFFIFAIFLSACGLSSQAQSTLPLDANIVELVGIDDLKAVFDQNLGSPHLVLILSPT